MGYTNSPLVVYTKLSPNHSGQRTHSIDRITPHCVVGQLSAESICGCFTSTSRQASCNYGIGTDGRVSLCVEEKNRSWCSSSNANDQRAVTIECASDMNEPYAMNSAVYDSLVKLCIDICKRNGKKKLLWLGDKNKTLNYAPAADEMVLTVHRWFANKSCPGNWLYARLGDLAARVTAALGGSSSSGMQASSLKNLSEGILTLYSDVQATSVRWLWYPFIAVGKITLLQGDPGDGKSTMMMHLIAELSKGGTLPDGKTIGMSQRAIYQCSEDGISDTIKPRLEKCGADCRNVAFINEETYSGLTLDDERIRQAIIEFRPRLVVIDPIQAYLGSDSDLQIAGRARRLMQRLGMWASMYDCAIVLIGHLNKKEGTKGLYRSLGSIDVVAAARSVLQVERDAEKSDIRIVRQIKNSLAPSDGEIRFSITAEQGFKWLECEIKSDPSAEPETPVFESKSEKAAYLIKKLLSGGDMRSREIYMRMSDEGISRRTAENTKKELGIRSYRKMRQWYWSMKPEE